VCVYCIYLLFGEKSWARAMGNVLERLYIMVQYTGHLDAREYNTRTHTHTYELYILLCERD